MLIGTVLSVLALLIICSARLPPAGNEVKWGIQAATVTFSVVDVAVALNESGRAYLPCKVSSRHFGNG